MNQIIDFIILLVCFVFMMGAAYLFGVFLKNNNSNRAQELVKIIGEMSNKSSKIMKNIDHQIDEGIQSYESVQKEIYEKKRRRKEKFSLRPRKKR